jgi:hypothetical protein
MQYPKSTELKVSFVINIINEEEYEKMKEVFGVSNLNDLKKVIAAHLSKHLLTVAFEGELKYIFEGGQRKSKIPVDELIKTRKMLEGEQEFVQEQIEEVKQKLPWE